MKIVSFETLIFLTLFTFSLCNKNEEKAMVINAKSDETQRISILVGKATDDGSSDSGGIGAMADGDQPNPDDTPIDLNVESAGFEWCAGGNKCCYQFTWQGYVQEYPAVENSTCEVLRKQNKHEAMACFDPLVYTISDSQSPGNSPNITQLTKDAQFNNWNIFCPLTKDKSCLTLKYFARSGGKSVMNETRFCGSITQTSSGSRITSGCYEENVQGSVRQVCACETSYCNSTGFVKFSPVFIVFSLIFYIFMK